jgi:esterase/lipase superfamily enzyme
MKKPFIKKLIWINTIVCSVFLFSGCSSYTDKPELRFRKFVGPDRVLVLLLPTIAGKGSDYEQQGFIEAVREKGFNADMKILDVDPVIYLQGRIVEVLKKELVDPAKVSGYKKILLVGISLGGHGALLYVTQSSEDVDGVVVLAPFIGGYLINDAIEKAGGLHKWENCPLFEWDYACDMWKLLKDYLSNPDKQRKVIIGYGTEDGFANGNQLLSEQLPQENVFTVPGGHDWMTWKLLWIKTLDYFHVSCTETGAYSCLIEVKRVPD